MKTTLLTASLLLFLFCNNLNSQVLSVPGHQSDSHSLSSAKDKFEKSNPSTEWKCDSIWEWGWDDNTLGWKKSRRILKSYDNEGKVLSITTVYWDFLLSQWTGVDKVTYEYYDTDTLKSVVWYDCKKTDNSWIETDHVFYQSDGRVYENEEKNYDDLNNVFTSGTKTITTYTADSAESLIQNLDIVTMTWATNSRMLFHYTPSMKISTSILQYWSNSDWWNYQKAEAIYDANEHLIDEIYFLWDQNLSVWNNDYKISHEYNITGWKIKSTLFGWNNIFGDWAPQTRLLYHYDENGSNTLSELDEYDDQTQLWIHSQKEVRSFYSNNKQNEYFRYIYFEAINQFMEFQYEKDDSTGKELEEYERDINYQNFEYYQGYRTVWTYSADGLPVEILRQRLVVPGMTWEDSWKEINTYDENKNLVLKEYENFAKITWNHSSKQEYFYSSLLGTRPEMTISDFCSFTSPLKAGEKITCDKLKESATAIFINMQGQIVSRQIVSFSGEIRVPSNLSAGIYILNIRSGSKSFSGKITIVN